MVLLPLAAATGSIEIVPNLQEACCESVQYLVTISNDANAERTFDLSADAERGITVTLEPSTISVSAKGEEKLVMFAKPECGLIAGEYIIKVSSKSTVFCENACGGDLCESGTGEANITLKVSEGCELPAPAPAAVTPAPAEPQNTANNNTPQTPSGAAVTTPQTGTNYFAVLVLFGLLAVLVVMLVLVKKSSKPGTKTGDAADAVKN